MTMTTETPTTDAGPDASGTIHPSELRQLLREHPETRVLDVRTGAEFESVHIPGSYNVPLDTLAEHLRDVAGVADDVVLVCQSGGRATTAQQKLNAAGTTNLRVLEGGMGGWQVAGGEVVKGEQKWDIERQVRAVAGAMVLASIVASIRFPKARFAAGAIGGGLLTAALTNTCAMGMALAKLPYNRGPECDLDGVLADLER